VSTLQAVRAPLPWLYSDGGRKEAGFRGPAGDCATRAIAIAAGMPYREAYDRVNEICALETGYSRRSRSSAREGVRTPVMRMVMFSLGWDWHPVMGIGTGCTMHMAEGEVPDGTLIARLSGHYSAVIGGTVLDAYDPCREGTRCVYGYWTPQVNHGQ